MVKDYRTWWVKGTMVCYELDNYVDDPPSILFNDLGNYFCIKEQLCAIRERLA